MLLEEFYNYDADEKKFIANYTYLHTLSCWIINNDFAIYQSLLDFYEQNEQYEVCEGIDRALRKIDEIMQHRFADAEKLDETDKEVVYSHEEHMRVSSLIFEDILKEIYEKQIDKYKENSGE